MEWLKARLAEGYRIGEAARLIGGGTDSVPRTPEALVDELVAATASRSFERLVRGVDHAFALLPAQRAIIDVAEPALKRVGELWETGDARVVDEHFLTELVRGKVRSLLDGGVGGSRGRAVLLCVPGERHEVGLLSLGVLLHADGWGVLYLGADTPLEEAVELARTHDAHVLCVSATMPEHASAAEPLLEEVARRHPGLLVIRGGAAFGGGPALEVVERLRAEVSAN